MGIHPSQQPLPTFGPCLLWPNGRPSQQLLSSCILVARPLLRLCFSWNEIYGNLHGTKPAGNHFSEILISKQLQLHDSVHLSSVYTYYSFSSILLYYLLRHVSHAAAKVGHLFACLCCYTSLLYPVYMIQPVVKPVVQPIDNRLNEQWLFNRLSQPVWQPVECLYTRYWDWNGREWE